MNWHLHQLKYAMGLGGIMSFYGIVAMIVWIAGTQFGWQVGSRVVVIALILITMPFALIIGFVASRRKKKEEKTEEKKDNKKDSAEEKEADEKGKQKLKKPIGTYEDIDKSSAEVVQFLKESNLGDNNGKDSVYSLPWYIVAGTPKSGKSSLVIGSRLDFQNLPSQRQSELKFVRPTRGIDWRVTADAVFVDTAGRYQTEGVDQDEWASLIETIKKHRSKRPIDGFLLVVNAEQILESNNAEVEQMAKILRARLDEAMQRIKVRFPVYLIFTHADGIEGFKDSFSRSKREGKNLVWGSTIPLEKSENGQTLFDSEYALLQDSVMKRRILRLSAPFPPVSQLRIFNFPLHFGSARRKIGAFVSTLFRPNPFSESPFLRGFYFTSAPSGRNNGSGGRYAAQTVGTTHFTERFFRDVLLRDKDLVRATQLQKQRAPILGWILTAFATVIALFLLTMAGVSLYNNKQLLNTSVEKGSAVIEVVKDDQAKGKNPLDKEPAQVQTELDKIDDLRDFMENNLEKYDREGAPLYLRFGLYSGDEIYKNYLLPTYFNAIEQRFKAPMIKRIEADLKKFAQSDPVRNASNITEQETENLDKHYNLLKAYLMLTEKYQDKAESTHLTNTLKDYWVNESKIPDNLRLKAENQLDFWVTQTDREDFPHIAPDDQLVSDARAKLQAFPAANRFYKAEVARINEELEKENVKITVQNILNENNASSNYIEGDYQVPSAYTRAGFALLNKSLTSEDTKLDQPDWVMGEESKKPTKAGEGDVETVKNLYLRDYAEHWTKFAQNIKVKPFSRNDIDFAKDALDSFSSANSSIVIVTREIARNTSFTEEIEDSAYAWYNPVGWYYSIMKYFESAEELETDKYTEVERDFQSLHDLFRVEKSSKGNPTPPKIEKYRDTVGNIAQDFKPLTKSEIIRIEGSLNKEKKHAFLKKLDSESKDLDGLLKDFKTPSARALANLYKQPFDNLRNLLGAGLKQQIEKTWSEDILPAAKNIEKSYPFSNGDEINMKDLTAFLNPTDGTLSLFYKERLQSYFDGEDESVRVKEGVDVQFNPEFVNYLKNAFRLRKALYGSSAKPEFKYGLTLQQTSNIIVEGTIDGSPIKSEGTGSANLSFPASSGENGVILRFDSTGEVPVSNNTANSPNSNVNTPTSNSMQDNSGCRSGANPIRCPGTWGLFRFFEAGSPVKQGEGYKLTYNYKGKTVTATITPNGGDLFNRNIFTSLRAPDSILK